MSTCISFAVLIGVVLSTVFAGIPNASGISTMFTNSNQRQSTLIFDSAKARNIISIISDSLVTNVTRYNVDTKVSNIQTISGTPGTTPVLDSNGVAYTVAWTSSSTGISATLIKIDGTQATLNPIASTITGLPSCPNGQVSTYTYLDTNSMNLYAYVSCSTDYYLVAISANAAVFLNAVSFSSLNIQGTSLGVFIDTSKNNAYWVTSMSGTTSATTVNIANMASPKVGTVYSLGTAVPQGAIVYQWGSLGSVIYWYGYSASSAPVVGMINTFRAVPYDNIYQVAASGKITGLAVDNDGTLYFSYNPQAGSPPSPYAATIYSASPAISGFLERWIKTTTVPSAIGNNNLWFDYKSSSLFSEVFYGTAMNTIYNVQIIPLSYSTPTPYSSGAYTIQASLISVLFAVVAIMMT